MWQKILWKAVTLAARHVDFKKILFKLLLRLAVEIREQTGLIVCVEKLDLDKVVNGIEEVLADIFGIEIDINDDGQIGDGEEG